MNRINTSLLAALLVAIFGNSVCAQFDRPGNDASRIEADARTLQENDTTLLNDVAEGRGRTVQQIPDKWIGVLCRPVDEVLRAHLGLDEGVGLVIERVVPNSPAARADLRIHDVLIQVDNLDLTSNQVLIEATSQADENGYTLRRIRNGERDLVKVVPEERPAEVARLGGPFAADNLPEMGRLREWVEQLEKAHGHPGDDPFRMRFFGPGVPFRADGFPSGISIQIQREHDQPAKITVQKGDTTWEVTEDSLDQLPDDVRPTVQGMLHGGAGIRIPMQGMENFPWPQFDRRLDNMGDQLQEMMEELRRLRREQEADDDDSIDA